MADNENRSTTPESDAFRQHISTGWAERVDAPATLRDGARAAAARRALLAAEFAGLRLVVPAGQAKQRSNDTDYLFRAHSDFAYLTGWGSDSEPGAVLVLEPVGGSHEPTLYFREPAGRDQEEFYANPAIGEFWVGPRPSASTVAGELGLATAHIDTLEPALTTGVPTAVIREADDHVTALVDALERSSDDDAKDTELARALSEMRLIKDAYEIDQMRRAVVATHLGFSDIARVLPTIGGQTRGERIIEGAFAMRARLEGNGLGYNTIAAAGAHACILHWERNDGDVTSEDLVLIDAGVELESYYTADITRTLPVSGRFTAAQRRVYEAVLEAADAAFAIVTPGITFATIHQTAMAVIARKTAKWGVLPVTAEESLAPENQHHRRYMIHGTSHHLGLDVHDCAHARRSMYQDGVVTEGMVFTIEPGLYFQPDDLTVPEELRGIGVRIEDNILVTANGAENLSAGIPRTVAEVESWIKPTR
jgi:Xaa-Pro aminopeptidase